MVRIRLNGNQVEAPAGSNLLMVALEQGVAIPHLCFHPALSAPASCRMCVVEVGGEGERQLVTACNTCIADGMEVRTDSERVAQARQAVLEFILLDHPLECPECERSGECELQDYVHAYGRDTGRSSEVKSRRGKQTLGPGLLLHADRCIGCARCVRFCEEVTGGGELSLFHRGAEVEVGIFPGEELDHSLVGNLVDLCPVGALTEPDSLSYQPVWTLEGVDSICPGCSSGCNVRVDVRGGRIFRLKPRVDLAVNQYWMCDTGRQGWRRFHGETRLSAPRVGRGDEQRVVSWDEALEAAGGILKQRFGPGAIAALCSGCQTNEENWLLARLVAEVWQASQVGLRGRVVRQREEHFAGGFAIRADRTPNRRGAREVVAGMGLELLEVERIWEGIETGRIRALCLLGGDPDEPLEERERRALERLDLLIVVDALASERMALADVVLPATSAFEKEGTFTNADGRVQRLRRAVAPWADSLPEWQILQGLAEAAGAHWGYAHPRQIAIEVGRRLGGVYASSWDAEEDAGGGRGQAYGGGWATWLQKSGLIRVEDHAKSHFG